MQPKPQKKKKKSKFKSLAQIFLDQNTKNINYKSQIYSFSLIHEQNPRSMKVLRWKGYKVILESMDAF